MEKNQVIESGKSDNTFDVRSTSDKGIKKMASNNKPAKTFKSALVSATVWKNSATKEGRTFDVYSVSVNRSYQDENKEWKNSTSFNAGDLPRLQLVLSKAYEFIALADDESDE